MCESRRLTTAVLFVIAASRVVAQTPQPFPKGSGQPPVAGSPVAPVAPASSSAASTSSDGAPTDAQLGFPVYPTATFLTSYDAGRGQRYFLFGTTASFAELVTYYRASLRERGTLVFDQPPTHMFEVGRFREETMAFPPGVTVKDYTWGGSGGYPNPVRGAQPARFPTVIQIVPAPPPAAPPARR